MSAFGGKADMTFCTAFIYLSQLPHRRAWIIRTTIDHHRQRTITTNPRLPVTERQFCARACIMRERAMSQPQQSFPTVLPLSDKQPRSFGADDHPACPSCGKRMHLIRRGPHPDHGSKYEIQTFLCASCNHEEIRSADWSGHPHP